MLKKDPSLGLFRYIVNKLVPIQNTSSEKWKELMNDKIDRVKNMGPLIFYLHATSKMSGSYHKRFLSFPAAKKRFGRTERPKPIRPLTFSEVGSGRGARTEGMFEQR